VKKIISRIYSSILTILQILLQVPKILLLFILFNSKNRTNKVYGWL